MVVPPSLRQRRVFVDSGAYLAILDESDEYQSQARLILHAIVRARYRQFTTNAVLYESHALIMRHLGRDVAARFLGELLGSTTTFVRVRALDERRAHDIIDRYADKDFSFVDAISFVVMERLGIRYAFTFDQHFAQYGLQVLADDTPL